MSRDDPIREYLDEDLPEERFHRLNKRLQMAIDRNLGWDREGAKRVYREIADTANEVGLARSIKSLTGDGTGLAFVRWRGCLWHLMVRVRVEDSESISARWAISACGEKFPVGMNPLETVEGKVDTDPHPHLTCMKCWEHVEAARVAQILAGDSDE